jgi:hypothetical protein
MAYTPAAITTFSRSTPNDGLLFAQEFNALYSDIENYIAGNGGAAPSMTLQQIYSRVILFLTATDITADKILEKTANAGVGRETVDGSIVRTKIIEIGDWNMDTTASKDVTHGLPDFKKIRNVSAIIKRDDEAIYWNLASITSAGQLGGSVGALGTSVLTLYRVTGGNFDSTDFDATSFNRGWVYIDYVD